MIMPFLFKPKVGDIMCELNELNGKKVFYIHDFERLEHYLGGITIAYVINGKEINYGLAICSSKERLYNKKIGREISYKNLVNKPKTFLYENALMYLDRTSMRFPISKISIKDFDFTNILKPHINNMLVLEAIRQIKNKYWKIDEYRGNSLFDLYHSNFLNIEDFPPCVVCEKWNQALAKNDSIYSNEVKSQCKDCFFFLEGDYDFEDDSENEYSYFYLGLNF